MNLTFKHKKITGILTVLPKNEVKFEEEMSNYHFSESKALKLKVTMGYNKRHIVEDGVTVSDLCTFGLEYLFNQQLLRQLVWQKMHIDAPWYWSLKSPAIIFIAGLPGSRLFQGPPQV